MHQQRTSKKFKIKHSLSPTDTQNVRSIVNQRRGLESSVPVLQEIVERKKKDYNEYNAKSRSIPHRLSIFLGSFGFRFDFSFQSMCTDHITLLLGPLPEFESTRDGIFHTSVAPVDCIQLVRASWLWSCITKIAKGDIWTLLEMEYQVYFVQQHRIVVKSPGPREEINHFEKILNLNLGNLNRIATLRVEDDGGPKLKHFLGWIVILIAIGCYRYFYN